MRASGRRLLSGACVLLLAWVSAVVALPNVAHAETLGSYAALYSLGGDPLVGGGVFRAGPDTITVSGSPDATIQVDLHQPPYGDHFHLRFAAPQGQSLAVGAYSGAKDLGTRSAADPAMEVAQDGQAKCSSTGSFEVRDLAPDLSHFWIAWERRCAAEADAAAFGEIRYNLPIDPDLFVGAAEMLWPQQSYRPADTSSGVPVTVTGANPVTFQSFAITGPGAAAFGVSNDYCTTVAPNQTCGLFVTYHPTLVGRREATLTIKDSTAAGTHTITLVDPGLAVDDPALVAAAGSPPDPVIGPDFNADFNSVTMNWTNPTTVDWADTTVRMLAGTRAPAMMAEGAQIYTGRGTTTRVDNLKPGTTYSFAVFTRDVEGLVGQPVTRTLPGAQLSLFNPPKRSYGGQIVLTGRLLDAVSGLGEEFVPVQAIAADPRTGAVQGTIDGRTGPGGGYQIPVTVGATYRWTIKSRGDSRFLGGISVPVLAPIKSRLTITPATAVTVKAGKALKIVGRALPISTSEPLLLQESVKNKWKTLAKQKPDRTGATTFTIKPKKGKHIYRVYRGDIATAESNPSGTVTVKAS